MTQDDIIQKLRHVMKQSSREKIDWDTVGADSQIQSLGFDSLTVLDLVYDIQQQFSVQFEAEELTKVKTVGHLAAFLGEKTNK